MWPWRAAGGALNPEVFTASLFLWSEAPGSWHFVAIPDALAPLTAGAWGRAPVVAEVDGRRWETSAWRDRAHGWLLAVPARVRGKKRAGDTVEVRLWVDGALPA